MSQHFTRAKETVRSKNHRKDGTSGYCHVPRICQASQQPGPTLFFRRDEEWDLIFKVSEERLSPLKDNT